MIVDKIESEALAICGSTILGSILSQSDFDLDSADQIVSNLGHLRSRVNRICEARRIVNYVEVIVPKFIDKQVQGRDFRLKKQVTCDRE